MSMSMNMKRVTRLAAEYWIKNKENIILEKQSASEVAIDAYEAGFFEALSFLVNEGVEEDKAMGIAYCKAIS